MKPKVITVEGSPIVIRPMDTGYLMADREPNGVEVAVGCRIHAKPEQWPNPMYVTYYRKLTDAYRACAILAWQGQSVVGFRRAQDPEGGQRKPLLECATF